MKRELLGAEEEEKIRRMLTATLARAGLTVPAPGEEFPDRALVTLEVLMPGADPSRPRPPIRLYAELDSLRGGCQEEPPVQELGSLRLDGPRRQVWLDGKALDLTPREFDLLCYLVRHRNLALTRNQLLDGVWEVGFRGDVRTVDTHVKCLRAKLGSFGEHIVTLRKVGYKLEWEGA